jgi:hypothetical protein
MLLLTPLCIFYNAQTMLVKTETFTTKKKLIYN